MTSTQIPHPSSLHLPLLSSLGFQPQIGGHVGGNLSSNISGFQPQIGNSSNFNNSLSIGGQENWRLPFLPGFEVPNNTNNLQFSYPTESVESQNIISLNNNSGIENPPIDPQVKAEDSRGLNLSRQFLGMMENTNPQPWAGNSWPEFPGVSTSTSTTHFL